MRIFDLTALLVAHILLAPIWLLLWIGIPICIWLADRGPVFYCQWRVGLLGKIFTVRKFRTMIPDAEKYTGAVWASHNDPRITPVGRFLRWTALDELPQVLNILKGEMALVGPRPERPELHREFADKIPGWDTRLIVRPGLTGLAQILSDYDTPPEIKLALDLYYIDNQSLRLNLWIVFCSVLNTLQGRWDHPIGRA